MAIIINIIIMKITTLINRMKVTAVPTITLGMKRMTSKSTMVPITIMRGMEIIMGIIVVIIITIIMEISGKSFLFH